MRIAPTIIALAVGLWLALADVSRASVPPAVVEAWTAVDQWLDRSPSGAGWRKFLASDDLGRAIAAGQTPEPATIAAVLHQLRSDAPGLEQARFRALDAALDVWLKQLAHDVATVELASLCKQAEDAFQPVSEQEVAWHRAAALVALDNLEKYLATNPHREAWEKFLYTDQVRRQLQPGATPNLPLLELVAARATAGHNAREMTQFVRFHQALDRYVQALRVATEDHPQQAYQARLAALAQGIEAYAADPSTGNLDRIAELVGELARRGQAPWVVEAVRHRLFQPNLFVVASADLVTYGIRRAVDEVNPVGEWIDGSWVEGTGRTIGQVTGSLGTSANSILLINHFEGKTYSDTVAFNRGVRVGSRGVTRFQAEKGVEFDGLHFAELPTYACARTSSCTKWVDAGRDGALSCVADRIAWTVVQKRLPRSEAAASRSAQRQIARRFGQGVNEAVEKAENNYREKVVHWLLNQTVFPEQLKTSSTPEAILVAATQMQSGQAGAPTAPPAAPETAAMSVRVHETAINNVAAAILGRAGLLVREFEDEMRRDERRGRTLRRDEVRAAIQRQFPNANLPEVDPNEMPWEMTFASREPIRVQFDRNHITITLRFREFGGAANFPDLPDGDLMIEAIYEIKQTAEGPVAELVDRPLVWYGAPGQTKYRHYLGIWLGLGAWDWSTPTEILGLLEEVEYQLEAREVIPTRIDGLIKLGGQWSGYGDLQPQTMTAENGWLTIGWKRVPKSDVQTVGTTDGERAADAGAAADGERPAKSVR